MEVHGCRNRQDIERTDVPCKRHLAQPAEELHSAVAHLRHVVCQPLHFPQQEAPVAQRHCRLLGRAAAEAGSKEQH